MNNILQGELQQVLVQKNSAVISDFVTKYLGKPETGPEAKGEELQFHMDQQEIYDSKMDAQQKETGKARKKTEPTELEENQPLPQAVFSEDEK